MSDAPIILNGATSQLDRRVAALSGDQAAVDGRSLASLLAFPAAFGKLIYFYDLNDRPDGTWEDFFVYDASLALARLAAIDMTARSDAFHALSQRTAEAQDFKAKFAALTALFAAAIAPARDVDAGLRALSADMPDAEALAFRRQIVGAIDDGLKDQLAQLASYAKGADSRKALGQAVPLDLAGFSAIWDATGAGPDDSIYDGRSRQQKIDSALTPIGAVFDSAMDGLAGLRSAAAAGLDATLATANHKPHLALYIAFLKLFGTAQDTINTMAQRYAAFYYHDVLRESFRKPDPDRVYLAFTLAADEDTTSTAVPADTLFPAGQDAAGEDILYGAEKSLSVTSAAVTDLRTIRVDHGPLVPAQGDASAIVAQRILSSVITIKPVEAAADAWTTFGPQVESESAAQVSTLARLGFAIASPTLMLLGGTRKITLDIRYSDESKQALDASLAALSQATGLDPATIFRAVLEKAFALTLSTADGWLAIPSYDVDLAADGLGFSLVVKLDDQAAGIAPFDPAPDAIVPADGPNPSPAAPTLRAYLRQDAVEVGDTGVAGAAVAVYPLSLLEPLRVTGWSIEVTVTDFAVAALASTDGEIDPTKPFVALGAPPVVGSFLDIAAPELFVKVPKTLSIALTWFALPPNSDGFTGWYRNYLVDLDGKKQDKQLLDNTSFSVGMTVHNAGTWTLAALSAEQSYLFRTVSGQSCVTPPDAKGALCQTTEFLNLTVESADRPTYYDPASSAIRIALAAPSYAFGDSLYAVNVLSSVLSDITPDSTSTAQSSMTATATATTDGDVTTTKTDSQTTTEGSSSTSNTSGDTINYPNPPWLPQAISVAITYTAGGTAGGTDGAYFYLLPFDGIAVSTPAADSPEPLLPDYPYPGNLYIGLSGLLPPVTQTLFFQMTAGGGAWPDPGAGVSWEILSGNDWETLSTAQILGDGSNSLQNSGIVALSLPAVAAAPGTLMPTPIDTRWLHVGATVPQTHPSTSAVLANALTARCRSADGSDRFAGPLPAGTIQSSVQDLPLVASIAQPAPSFGGRPAQTGQAFQTWLGERLRHKNRAIQTWDIERLVLEAFPTIWQVQALPARDATGAAVPGHILVVVVPGSDSSGTMEATTPYASPDLLSQIDAMLAEVITPFVVSPFGGLQIANPLYVRITVSAQVQFAADSDAGAALKLLNAELIEYLSPWFYDAARAAQGANYVTEDAIAEFIETRPYVDALAALSLAYTPGLESVSWCFLTSATQHALTAVDSGPCELDALLSAPVAT